jgi:dihydroneopterin aldolase
MKSKGQISSLILMFCLILFSSNAQLNCEIDTPEILIYSDYIDSFFNVESDSSIDIWEDNIFLSDTIFKINDYMKYCGSIDKHIETQFFRCLDSLEDLTDYSMLDYDTNQIKVEFWKHRGPITRDNVYIGKTVDAVIEEPDTLIDFEVLSHKIFLYHSVNDSIPYIKSSQSTTDKLYNDVQSYMYKDDCKKFCFKDVYIQDINGNVLKLEGIRECYNIKPKNK